MDIYDFREIMGFMTILGRSGHAKRGHYRWRDSVHLVTLSWVSVFFNRQEPLGAQEGRFCRNLHVSSLFIG